MSRQQQWIWAVTLTIAMTAIAQSVRAGGRDEAPEAEIRDFQGVWASLDPATALNFELRIGDDGPEQWCYRYTNRMMKSAILQSGIPHELKVRANRARWRYNTRTITVRTRAHRTDRLEYRHRDENGKTLRTTLERAPRSRCLEHFQFDDTKAVPVQEDEAAEGVLLGAWHGEWYANGNVIDAHFRSLKDGTVYGRYCTRWDHDEWNGVTTVVYLGGEMGLPAPYDAEGKRIRVQLPTRSGVTFIEFWADDGEIRVMHTANAGWMGRERQTGALMKRGLNARGGCLQHTKARTE